MKITEVALSEIQLDPRAQPRCELNPNIVEEYAEAMKAGDALAPIDVFATPDGMILADGYHRFKAAPLAGLNQLPATLHQGGRRDAILFAAGANAAHGLRRTNADKRRAVITLLEDPEWQQWSDTQIAHQCRVSRPLVAEVRAELEAKKVHPAELQDGKRIVKRRGKVYSMKVAKRHGEEGQKQTPSCVPADAEVDSTPWIEFLLALPDNDLFQLSPADIAPLVRHRGFTPEQARQLEGFFMRLAFSIEKYGQESSELDGDELAAVAFDD